MQMDMGQQGRGGRRKNGNNGYNVRRKKKRHEDPKFYANDSDFDSSSDNDDEKKSNNNNNNKISNNKKSIYIGNGKQTFDKVDIQPTMPNKQKSALSAVMDGWSSFPSREHSNHGGRGHGHGKNGHGHGHGQRGVGKGQRNGHHHHHNHNGGGRSGGGGQGRNGHHMNMNGRRGNNHPTQNHSRMMNGRYEPESEHNRGGLFHSFVLTVYFGEYLQEEPIKIEITTPMTVAETMDKAIQQWGMERAIAKLKGTMASHYTMRTMDIEESGAEIDDDVPAFGKHLKIHTLGEKTVGLQFIGRGASNSVGYESGPSSMDKQSEKHSE